MSGVVAIVNPAAGGGRSEKLAPAALERLRGAGIEAEVLNTSASGDATRLAREAYGRGVRGFIAVGGDGTSYEIVNGIFPQALEGGDRPWLGFLPLGTGNSFLRDFTDEGADHSITALTSGNRRPCDVVRLSCDGGEIFYINLLSLGFTADVGSMANDRFKGLGDLGYVLAVVLQTARLGPRAFRMRLDDARDWNQYGVFVSFCNSRYTGGKMMMAPYADTGDGKLDVVMAGDMARRQLLAAFPRIFKGTHVHLPTVTSSQASVVEIDVDGPMDLMVDGEVIHDRPRRLEVLSGALDVCV
ncbi:MAG: YegS/Rv2252/BmrU family lipid kinase [Myxococcales bacterium]|nr:YegS/Rv2252/BmrU family lipid kinase [Myxococcales bacterium]